ncbi:hypothetical protein HQ560_18175 [bacterium]|nr:hypothetical protein [bacterium]
MALILMAAGHGRLVAYPFWSAVILALFGCGYALASTVFKDAFYVYPTLGLWTFAFFQVCYAASVPPFIFPPVATVLVWLLWMSAANKRLAEQFNTAIYRGVFLATVFFGLWSVFAHAGQLAVPATTFLLYGLSMACFHHRRPRPLYAYSAGIYLAIGAFYAAAGGVLTRGQTGPAVQMMVLLILLLGVLEHGRGRFAAAKPHYAVGATLSAVCLLLSLLGGRFLLDQFAMVALTLGIPVILFEFQAASGKRDPLPSNQDVWLSGLLVASRASGYAAVPLVIVAPLMALGHVMWAAVLLAALSALAVGLNTRGGSGVAGNLHKTAFFTAISVAWLAGAAGGYSGPAVLGVSVTSALWIGLWLVSRRTPALHRLALHAADGQAVTAAALVCVTVLLQAWHANAGIAAAVGLTCAVMVLAGEGRRPGWMAASACAAVLLAAVTGMRLEAFAQWWILELVACACLALAYSTEGRARRSAVFSTAALVLALCGVSIAVTLPGSERSILCLAGSLGVLFALGASFYHQKLTAAIWLIVVINVIGAFVLLWAGRLVSVTCLGTAFLLLVPFLAAGWLKSRVWPYAGSTAVAFALGALLLIGGAVGTNWIFMLAAAVICTMLLRVRPGGDTLSGAAVAAVGHALAIVMVLMLCRRADAVADWRAVPALVLFGLAYLSAAGRVPSGRAVAWVFFSLATLPATAALFGTGSGTFLVVSAVLVPVWAIVGFKRRARESGVDGCRASALLGVLLCLIAALRGPDGASLLFVLCLAGF